MDITTLINKTLPHIPFKNVAIAQAYLDQFDPNDQLALISALYIGRSSYGDKLLDTDVDADRNHDDHIGPNEFARILYEKNTNLTRYYEDFLRSGENTPGFLSKF